MARISRRAMVAGMAAAAALARVVPAVAAPVTDKLGFAVDEGEWGAVDLWETVRDPETDVWSILRNHVTVLTTKHAPDSAAFTHIMDALTKGALLEIRPALRAGPATSFIHELWAADAPEGSNDVFQAQYLIRNLADGLVCWIATESRALDFPWPYAAVIVDSAVEIQNNPNQRAHAIDILHRTVHGPTANIKSGSGIVFTTLEELEDRLTWPWHHQAAWRESQMRLHREDVARKLAEREERFLKLDNLSTTVNTTGLGVGDILEFEAITEWAPTMGELVAGAMFDFLGFLTSRPEVTHLSRHHDAVPMLEAFKVWSELRGFHPRDARVLDWQEFVPKAHSSSGLG